MRRRRLQREVRPNRQDTGVRQLASSFCLILALLPLAGMLPITALAPFDPPQVIVTKNWEHSTLQVYHTQEVDDWTEFADLPHDMENWEVQVWGEGENAEADALYHSHVGLFYSIWRFQMWDIQWREELCLYMMPLAGLGIAYFVFFAGKSGQPVEDCVRRGSTRRSFRFVPQMDRDV